VAVGFAVACAVVVFGLRVGAARGQPIDSDTPLAEVAVFVQARAAFARNCYRCHTAAGEEAGKKSLERLDMTRYPFGGKRGPVAGRAVKKALGGVNGTKATMPKDDPESLSAEDLAIILRWADTFETVRSPKEPRDPRDKEPRAEASSDKPRR
jgi:mono/diheme cytochrome c family protein